MARKHKGKTDKPIRWSPVIIDPSLCTLLPEVIAEIKYCPTYIRHSIYSIDTIFGKIHGDNSIKREQMWDMNGEQSLVQIARIEAFKLNQSCVCCGITGSIFVTEKHRNRPTTDRFSLMLYAIDHNDELVALTVDHILPDSMGGKYASTNFQVMCQPCNRHKAHLLDQLEIDRIKATPTLFAKHWVSIPLLLIVLGLREQCLNCQPDELPELNDRFETNRQLLAFNTPNNVQLEAINQYSPKLEHVTHMTSVQWYVNMWMSIVKAFKF